MRKTKATTPISWRKERNAQPKGYCKPKTTTASTMPVKTMLSLNAANLSERQSLKKSRLGNKDSERPSCSSDGYENVRQTFKIIFRVWLTCASSSFCHGKIEEKTWFQNKMVLCEAHLLFTVCLFIWYVWFWKAITNCEPRSPKKCPNLVIWGWCKHPRFFRVYDAGLARMPIQLESIGSGS